MHPQSRRDGDKQEVLKRAAAKSDLAELTFTAH